MSFLPIHGFRSRLAAACGLLSLALAATTDLAALELKSERGSPFDLEVSGHVPGLAKGAKAYVSWAELRQLPTEKIMLDGEFVKGKQELTIVWLKDLWAALPKTDDADTLLATCTDGYFSVYKLSFIDEYKPFLVLEINGLGPDHWPPPGLKYNPGPYVISISEEIVPAVATLLDAGHKKPWGTNAVVLASYAESFAGAFSGNWSSLSDKAVAGRDIWINSCSSCHAGPQGIAGGWKANRPFEVLAAHAGFNKEYFKGYVREPTKMMPGAKMEAHPHYTDAQLDELIAFIMAEKP